MDKMMGVHHNIDSVEPEFQSITKQKIDLN